MGVSNIGTSSDLIDIVGVSLDSTVSLVVSERDSVGVDFAISLVALLSVFVANTIIVQVIIAITVKSSAMAILLKFLFIILMILLFLPLVIYWHIENNC